jgi:hypothetical protein
LNAELESLNTHRSFLEVDNSFLRHIIQRSKELAALITSIDLAHVEENILFGALLFLKDKITTQDPTGLTLVEAWRDAGDRFLRRSKSKKEPPTLPLETASTKSKSSQKSS